MSNILIIGYGIVGKNLSKELSSLNPDIFDKYKDVSIGYGQNKKYDVAFICVDTPFVDKSEVCDVSEVQNAINEYNSEIYVLKSTVLPGTTDRLISETQKKIIFSPEYYGSTNHCNNFEFPFTILGGNKKDTTSVQQILQDAYDARHRFYHSDSSEAEIVKYMENSYLAMKVTFCNEFYKICKKNNVDYETVREMFISDPRVNPSHTFVYNDHPYWDSHCLNKDVRAIAISQKSDFLMKIVETNNINKELTL